MLLEAIVPNSIFNDVLKEISPREIRAVSRNPDDYVVPQALAVTVSCTYDRLLKFAQLVQATFPPLSRDFMRNECRLRVKLHNLTKNYEFETFEGSICFWADDPIGGYE